MASLGSYSIFSIWNNNCEGSFTIVNNTNSPINNWTATIIITSVEDIMAYDLHVNTLGGGLFQITPKEWNGTLQPGASVYTGFKCQFTTTPPIIYPYSPIPPPSPTQPGDGGNYNNI